MDIPTRCSFCGQEEMLDWLHLEVRQLTKLYWEEGFTCSNCSRWQPLFYITIALEQNIKRVNMLRPTHPSFWYHFYKTVKRAEVIQENGRAVANITR